MNVQERDPVFEELLQYLKYQRGFDFTGYKRTTLMRRVQRRMQVVEVESFEDYLDYLEVHPDEFAFLFNTILINVTSFFRDEEAWDYLAQHVIPRIVENRQNGEHIRIWSAGCATGEEPYTLAMLLAEALGLEKAIARVKIYATDVDEEALAHARQATYDAEDVEDVPPDLLEKYFESSGERYTFRSDLRRSVIFGRHDLMQDAPISRLDLLVCRNTLIYFNAEAQRRILSRFHFAVNDDGYIFLGKAEMLLTHAHLFTPLESSYRIFSKVPSTDPRDRLAVMAEASHQVVPDRLGMYIHLRDAAFQAISLPHVVVNQAGQVVMVNEAALTTLDLDPRDVGRPFRDLQLSYRPVEMRSIIEQAYDEERSITLRDVEWAQPSGETLYLNIQITPLRNNHTAFIGVSILYEDVTPYHELQEELQHSREELETAYEELQSSNEELETTNEELQSTVEELQTTNEELQSSNEEMETMNEELRSANEELQSMNQRLQERTGEASQVNTFLYSILTSVQAGVVVLDEAFEVLLWNEEAHDLWGLRAEEVEGRSFFELDIGLPVEELRESLMGFMDGRTERGSVTLDAVNRRGRRIACHVTYTCLETRESQEDGSSCEGVVLLMRGEEV
jgi:two-component system CheB/CheR fusion protein